MLGCLPFLLLLPLAGLLAFWLATRRWLGGEDLSVYDDPPVARATSRTGPSPEIANVHALLRRFSETTGPLGSRGRIRRVREVMDRLGDDLAGPAVREGVRLTPVRLDGISGEWVTAPEAEEARRLLYVHGGAFFAGSHRSHRPLTIALSRRARAAVFAVDYRLMPEHPRRAGIADCQRAYRYVLEQGPSGASALERFFVAGDSAGGSLALMLIAWARDRGLRPVDAALAFSPTTDATGSSPTYRENRDSDVMLGPLLGRLASVPRTVLLWGTLLGIRMRPCDPLISPVFGDLSALPPVLVQASEAEMLLGDARRYVNKAVAAGSPAVLQTWPGMVHVWQIFGSMLPEAGEALDEVGRFLAR